MSNTDTYTYPISNRGEILLWEGQSFSLMSSEVSWSSPAYGEAMLFAHGGSSGYNFYTIIGAFSGEGDWTGIKTFRQRVEMVFAGNGKLYSFKFS